jgi:TetR/AcrR family transcriptional repressor of nem operon
MARPRGFDEETAVRAARDAFRRTGYAGTSLSDLSQATGLGKGSLYNTFGDKDQLFSRVFAEYCAEADTNADQLFEESDGLDAALGYLGMITRETIADRDHVGCMIANTTAELSVSSPSVVDRASKTFQHIEDLIAGALADSDIADGEDPRDLARLLVAITRGIEALGKAGYSDDSLRAIEATAGRLLAK